MKMFHATSGTDATSGTVKPAPKYKELAMNKCILFLLPILLLSVYAACNNTSDQQEADPPEKIEREEGHHHGAGDALFWPKKDVVHEGFQISLGHHGNHWHHGDQIEPAVAIVKDGKDIGDATITCQLFDDDEAIEMEASMIFEPKTEEEPAHFAGAKLTFPAEKNVPGQVRDFAARCRRQIFRLY